MQFIKIKKKKKKFQIDLKVVTARNIPKEGRNSEEAMQKFYFGVL